jgi:hypothetical protein
MPIPVQVSHRCDENPVGRVGDGVDSDGRIAGG